MLMTAMYQQEFWTAHASGNMRFGTVRPCMAYGRRLFLAVALVHVTLAAARHVLCLTFSSSLAIVFTALSHCPRAVAKACSFSDGPRWFCSGDP
mmetsp:Transcript_7960/g.19656  ORF Transcript_7960/g.19656 Transcript_7960/m.19656 type:complete len:94 (+) Transcript_7960:1482-1763(+)